MAALAALIGLGISQARADQTNIVQDLDFQLTGVAAGGAVTNHDRVTTGYTQVAIDEKDVIATLGAATGNTFSRHARLVSVTPVAGGVAAIQVRDGTAKVDVTGFFSHQQISDAVSGSVSNTVRQRTTAYDFSIQQIVLQDDSNYPVLGMHFTLSGFATESSSSTDPSGAEQLTINVSGVGDENGALLILQGTVTMTGSTLEVVPGGGLPL